MPEGWIKFRYTASAVGSTHLDSSISKAVSLLEFGANQEYFLTVVGDDHVETIPVTNLLDSICFQMSSRLIEPWAAHNRNNGARKLQMAWMDHYCKWISTANYECLKASCQHKINTTECVTEKNRPHFYCLLDIARSTRINALQTIVGRLLVPGTNEPCSQAAFERLFAGNVAPFMGFSPEFWKKKIKEGAIQSEKV